MGGSTPRRTATIPLQRAISELQGALTTAWPGPRVLKTALAVRLAWGAGQALGQATPVFAALAALQALRPTVAESLRQTGGQVIGMLVGGLLAAVGFHFFGNPGPLDVGLTVLLALLATVVLRATSFMGAEVAVAALLVLFYSSRQQPFFALERLWEAALGGATAIVVNALIMPPDYSHDLRDAVDALVDSLIDHTSAAVNDLIQRPAPEVAWAHLLAARTATREASDLLRQSAKVRESLRFSPLLAYGPLYRGRVARMERQLAGVALLVGALGHARSALRSAWGASRLPPPARLDEEAWRALLAAVIEAIGCYEVYLDKGGRAARAAGQEALAAARQQHAALVADSPLAAPESWEMERATVLAEIDHLLDDLGQGLADRPAAPRPAGAPATPVGVP